MIVKPRLAARLAAATASAAALLALTACAGTGSSSATASNSGTSRQATPADYQNPEPVVNYSDRDMEDLMRLTSVPVPQAGASSR